MNYKTDEKYPKGTGFFKLKDIAEDLHWYSGYRKVMYSKSHLSKALKRLRDGFAVATTVATTVATRGIVVTICKYDYYQDPKNYGGNDGGRAEATLYKNKERIKKEEREEKDAPPSDAWLKTQEWLTANCKQVTLMKEPFTEEQFEKIKMDYSSDQIKQILLSMHNWNNILKNRSANLTFRKWASKEFKKSEVSKPNDKLYKTPVEWQQ